MGSQERLDTIWRLKDIARELERLLRTPGKDTGQLEMIQKLAPNRGNSGTSSLAKPPNSFTCLFPDIARLLP